MATVSLRLSDDDNKLFKRFAEFHGLSMSDFIRQTVLERIEDEYDLKIFREALAEFEQNQISYSHDEVLKMLEQD